MFPWCLWSPLSPPQRFPFPSSMSPNNLPARASLSPPLASSPSVFRLFDVPPSSAGCHPPSTHITDWRPVPCCPWCPVQCPNFWGFDPPTCAAGSTWLGCGWRGVGDGAPPIFLRFSMRFRHTNRTNRRSISGAIDSPRKSWCLSLSAPPPPSPFPRTTILFPIPSLPTGDYFCGLHARPLPIDSPWPWTLLPPKRCQGPIPCPPSPFRCHSRGLVTP